MKKDEVLRILRTNEATLRRDYFVKSLALFGSVARDEAGPDSDVDLLVEFARPTGYFGLVRLQLLLEQLLGCEVDLGTPGSLRPTMRQASTRRPSGKIGPGRGGSCLPPRPGPFSLGRLLFDIRR
jgi:uncharacterized protein